MDKFVGHSKGFVEEFKAFAVQGNIMDLAVAVVIGAAFNAVVTSLVNDIIMQLVAWAFGKPDFTAIVLGPVRIGSFLTAVVNFLIIALSVFLTVKVMMRWMPKKETPIA